MGLLTGIIKLFFGTKDEKDRKEIQPYVDKIIAAYPAVDALTNDQLRALTQELRLKISDYIKPNVDKIAALKVEMEDARGDIDSKERIAKEIDKLTKETDQKIEEVLLEIMPQAFSIVKSTARRFTENDTIEVTANDFDRNLAVAKDFVTIEGDKAIFANSWLAGGNKIKWDMIHHATK